MMLGTARISVHLEAKVGRGPTICTYGKVLVETADGPNRESEREENQGKGEKGIERLKAQESSVVRVANVQMR